MLVSQVGKNFGERKERKDVTFEKYTSSVMCLFEGTWGIIGNQISLCSFGKA
jgi:hypothetical protein